MNALKLADLLVQGHYPGGTREQAAMTLRQQHAEIEALKAEATNTVMAEYCTCYKLGYSQLNNYKKVKK